ncbi:hypothetical protein J6590_047625 [Homalodisca vitripennis]|nr:hypothetical protein J6590_047625 [Homalodisca vitripennis]
MQFRNPLRTIDKPHDAMFSPNAYPLLLRVSEQDTSVIGQADSGKSYSSRQAGPSDDPDPSRSLSLTPSFNRPLPLTLTCMAVHMSLSHQEYSSAKSGFYCKQLINIRTARIQWTQQSRDNKSVNLVGGLTKPRAHSFWFCAVVPAIQPTPILPRYNVNTVSTPALGREILLAEAIHGSRVDDRNTLQPRGIHYCLDKNEEHGKRLERARSVGTERAPRITRYSGILHTSADKTARASRLRGVTLNSEATSERGVTYCFPKQIRTAQLKGVQKVQGRFATVPQRATFWLELLALPGSSSGNY